MSTKKLLSYSSVFVANWLIARITFSLTFWIKFFLIYSIFLFNIIIFQYFFILSTNKMVRVNDNIFNKIIIMVLIFNIIGLPPFPIFFIKLFMVKLLIINYFYIALLLLIASRIFIYMYTSFTFKFLFNYSNKTFRINFNYNNYLIYLLISLTLFVTWTLITI